MTNTAKKIPVVELYGPVIQGEGALCGQVSYFLRTGGCAYRCTWCDSMHAVDPKQIRKHAKYMTCEEIAQKVRELNFLDTMGTYITLTGGDPLMWDLEPLVHELGLEGYKFAIETQGSLSPDWVKSVDVLTCSPKPPSSGMSDKLSRDTIQEYLLMVQKRLNLKVVIFDELDLQFAERLVQDFPTVPMYLSVGTPTASQVEDDNHLVKAILTKYRWLTEQVIRSSILSKVTISPQMHALIYGHKIGY